MNLLFVILLTGWRLYPSGTPIQVTVEHELYPSIDTVHAMHWHKSGNKFYVITTDSTELWVDNVNQIKGDVK